MFYIHQAARSRVSSQISGLAGGKSVPIAPYATVESSNIANQLNVCRVVVPWVDQPEAPRRTAALTRAKEL